MKALIITIFAAALAGGAAFLSNSSEAECAYCFRGDCYGNSVCGTDCVCLRKDSYSPGSCVTLK